MQVITNKFRNLSVIWKFIFAYIAILIMPIIFLGIFLYQQTLDSAIEQAQIVMEQNLFQTKNSILQKVNIIENVSQIIIYDNKIQTFLDYGFLEKDNEEYDYENYTTNIVPFVENILRQNREINSIRIYMQNQAIPEVFDSFYSINQVKNRKWYREFLTNSNVKHNVWHGIHDEIINITNMSKETPEPVLSYTSKIRSINSNKIVGLLDIEIKEETIFDVLKDPIIDKFGRVFIIDKEGTILSNNYPEIFKEKIDLSEIDFSKNIRKNIVRKTNNTKSIVISIPLKEIDCRILGIFPVDNFTIRVKDSLPSIVLVLLGFSLLFIIFIYLVTNVLMGRIKRLVKAMKQIREGNLNISVPVGSRDEFGNLALSFNHMVKRIYNLVETVYKIELMEREAELKALEAQINPHFLYNTLSTISWVARKAEYPEIVKISNSLARFYRLVLSKGDTVISIKEELDIVKYYLDIQKIRFNDLFDVVYEIDSNVLDYKMVKNIVQPLAENALEHGIEPKRGHGTIIIKSFEFDKNIVIQIIDDGIGMTNTTLDNVLNDRCEDTKNSGYAIKNIKKRLKAYYGEKYSFQIYSKLGIGTVVTITINKILF